MGVPGSFRARFVTQVNLPVWLLRTLQGGIPATTVEYKRHAYLVIADGTAVLLRLRPRRYRVSGDLVAQGETGCTYGPVAIREVNQAWAQPGKSKRPLLGFFWR